MPALLVSSVRYDEYMSSKKGYLLWMEDLVKHYPDISTNDEVRAYALEIYDNKPRLLRRFKPPLPLILKIVQVWDGTNWKHRLKLPEDFVNEHGIAQSYYVVLLITNIGVRAVFPYEVKVLSEISYGGIVERLKDCYGALGFTTFRLFHLLDEGKPKLVEAMQYLIDGYHRYVDGDLEGSITQLRKAVQVLRDKVLPKVQELEGIKSLRDYSEELAVHLDCMLKGLSDMIKTLFNILSIGGPHPGPVPRDSTLLAFKLTLSLIEYLAKVA